MSELKLGAIVPVKTFSKAKTRLNLPTEKTEIICEIMLGSVLAALSRSNIVEKIAIVSRDETALDLGKKFGAFQIYDEKELGVNNAVRLADSFFLSEGFAATIVFPQDVPLIQPEDIQTLCEFRIKERCILVVPSRKFDGTNALFRMPLDAMDTHYDEDSYKIHLSTAEKRNIPSALVLIRRLMLDVDDQSDLDLIIAQDLAISKSLSGVLGI